MSKTTKKVSLRYCNRSIIATIIHSHTNNAVSPRLIPNHFERFSLVRLFGFSHLPVHIRNFIFCVNCLMFTICVTNEEFQMHFRQLKKIRFTIRLGHSNVEIFIPFDSRMQSKWIAINLFSAKVFNLFFFRISTPADFGFIQKPR